MNHDCSIKRRREEGHFCLSNLDELVSLDGYQQSQALAQGNLMICLSQMLLIKNHSTKYVTQTDSNAITIIIYILNSTHRLHEVGDES